MKFWQSFSKKSVLRQFLFVLALFALLIPMAIWDSNTQVKVSFDSDSVDIYSDKYNMNIPYDIIESAELTDLADPGEKVEEGWDNDIIRTGVWTNAAWGEYHIVADLDASTCIVVHLNDGRIFVFNSKDNEKTAELYDTLQGHLTPVQ